jgi:Protein of unknown function (DUF2510)
MPMSQHIGEIDPGWYPDPHGEPCDRYWDGHTWTDRTRPMVITLPARQPDPPEESPAEDPG